jgi:hypothetical protein
MTKEQAYHAFLASFGWPVYDENTVPDDASLPRITYNFADAEFDAPVAMPISVWDRSTSWASVTAMKDRIYNAIRLGGKIIRFDGGYIWVKRGQPFSQRMADENDSIRRIYIVLEVEYLTAN